MANTLQQAIQSIKFLYADIRNVGMSGGKVKPSHLISIARTFDALDNSLETEFNAQKVVASGVNSTGNRLTCTMNALASHLQSVHVKIPKVPKSTGGFINFTPTALNINSLVVPVTDALFDIQQSPDDLTWNSILSAPAHLPAGQFYAPTVTTFPGTNLIGGNWARFIVALNSDFVATFVQIELDLVQAP